MLSIQTVPDLRLSYDGTMVPGLVNTKGAAIIAYLALSGGRASRTQIAGLLWSDLPEADALNNLRFTLSRLRRQMPGIVEASRSDLTLAATTPCQIDVRLVDAMPSEDLIGLRVEDFLANLYPPNAEGFREWVARTRDSLSERYLARLTGVAETLAREGRTDLAAEAYRRCLALAPWSEGSHRALARLHVAEGDLSGALAQLATCRDVLRRDLSVDPEPETAALEAEIRERRNRPTRRQILGHGARQVSGAGLPDFGMAAERQRLHDLLQSPGARIVTILGPGGVGKTHLARQVARDLAPAFAGGVAEVRLDDIEPLGQGRGAALLVARIAAALGVDPVPGRELATLGDAAGRLHMLVLLDNFETVADAFPTLGALSERAPGLTFLVTSRHQVGLPTEWVVRLDGLDWPHVEEWRPEHADSPAVALFCRTAERLGLPIDLPRDGNAVLRICAALEGWPLGLILAASWLQALTVGDVARQIVEGSGLLADPAPIRIAARHHSATAVLEQSWQLLTPPEQAAFAALSIFAGRFDAAAAAAVSNVTPQVLASLTGKSIVRRDGEGAWSLHPLLRAFGLRQLQRHPDAAAQIGAAHFARSSATLTAARIAFGRSGDPASFDVARSQIGDHLQAFRHASKSRHGQAMFDLSADLWLLYSVTGWIEDGLALLDAALTLPEVPPRHRAEWLRWRSDALFQLGRMDAADEAARGALAALGEPPNINAGPLGIAAGLARVLLGLRHSRTGSEDRVHDRAIPASRAWNRIAQVRFFDGDRNGFVASTLHSATYAGAALMPGNLGSVALLLNYTPFRPWADGFARQAEARLDRGNPFDRGWTRELLALHHLGRGSLADARHHAIEGANQFRRLGQRRNWSECQALAAYALFFGGETDRAGAEMRALRHEGALLRDGAAEVWGALGALFADLSRGVPVAAFDADRARALAVQVSDPNTDLLLHGNLAWHAASEGRFDDAVGHRKAFDAVFRRASMLSVYALNGFHSDIEALCLITDRTGRGAGREAHRAIQRLRDMARAFPAARPFLAWANERTRHLRT